MKINLPLMKQYPFFLYIGKLLSFFSIQGSCGFWKGAKMVPESVKDEREVHGSTGIAAALPIVCLFTWVFSFSLFSNLFPYIIMTQRRVVTLQAPFGWILMRGFEWLWQMGAFCMAGCSRGGEKPRTERAWPLLCPEGLYTWAHTCVKNLAILRLDDGREDYREQQLSGKGSSDKLSNYK